MGLLSWIKGVFRRMFQPVEVYQVFGVQPAITSVFLGAIEDWGSVYQGLAPWNEEIPSAHFAATVAAEAARLATIEMDFQITGSPRADFLQGQMDAVRDRLRTQVEYACAGGGLMFKPNGRGVDFIPQGDFLPTDVDGNGNITGAIFIAQQQDKERYFNLFEYHRFEGDVYRISHRAYESESPNTIGRPTTLAAVPGWADALEEISVEHLEHPLFAYFRMPWANTIDSTSPLGCSIFAKAIGTIHDIDITAAGLRHEISTAERKLFVADVMLRRDDNGRVVDNPLPHLIQGLEYGVNETNTYHEFNPEIRVDGYKATLQTFLNLAGNQCGFSNGYFSFDEKTGVVTATQVESDQQRTISTVTDIQKALRTALSGLTYALDAYATLYGLAPAGAYEELYNLKDLNVNVTEDRARAWQMATAGAIPKWKYLVDYEGYTEEEAREISTEALRKQMFWSYVMSGKFPMWKYLEMFEGFSEADAKQLVADAGGGVAGSDPYGFGGSSEAVNPEPGDTGSGAADDGAVAGSGEEAQA